MSDSTGGERPVEELEAAVLVALDRYFEIRRTEVEKRIEKAGAGFGEYEEARRQLVEAEQELEELRRSTAELQTDTLGAVTRSVEATELEQEVSALQEEVRELADAEKTALERKMEAEERLRRAEQAINGDIGELADGVAAFALRKAEEIDAFKGRLDQRFAEGRSSVLGAAT
jgi:exonuclease VII large subunit